VFRSKYAYEKPNDLGAGMYALILVFGFGWLMADVAAYPPRVVAMLALTFCECGAGMGAVRGLGSFAGA
jgi:hypothetical protein